MPDQNDVKESPTVTGRPDGRKARGDARRAKIIDGVLSVLARDGVAGVSQRAVAREAGVPAASVFYYFETVQGMLASALVTVNTRYLAAIAAAQASGRDPLICFAEITRSYGDASRRLALAEFETYLLATRDPTLRREVDAWWTASDALLLPVVPDPTRRRAIISLADGIAMRALIDGESPTVADVTDLFRLLAG